MQMVLCWKKKFPPGQQAERHKKNKTHLANHSRGGFFVVGRKQESWSRLVGKRNRYADHSLPRAKLCLRILCRGFFFVRLEHKEVFRAEIGQSLGQIGQFEWLAREIFGFDKVVVDRHVVAGGVDVGIFGQS